MDDGETRRPTTGAEGLLLGLKASGIDYLFANAGTDFPPIIEAMASLPAHEIPTPITIPHETAGVAMAHGYYLVTGRAQAVMFHVNVGLANAVMGVINAASDNVPVLVMSGRTPITETHRPGHRVTPIHYGQEMFDQTSLLRDVVKFNYELRYPEQAGELVGRAMALANSAPDGPVYLSLPREPLAEDCPEWTPTQTVRPKATPAAPDPSAISTLSSWLRAAKHPTILCQRGDPEGALGDALAAFATRHGIRIVSPFMTRNLLASDHPNFAGYAPDAVFAQTDLLIVMDSPTPWVAASNSPPDGCKIAHIGPDPHFARLPMRGHQTDLAIQADPYLALTALDAALSAALPGAAARNSNLKTNAEARRAKLSDVARKTPSEPMSAEWLSHCVGEVMGDTGVAFSDLGVLPGFMDLKGPNRVFISPHSGGLGWAMNAALGAQLADRDQLVIACVGDGSYMFANPVAAHQIAEALELPILTIVKNNAMWNAVRRSVIGAYPDGAAAKANEMPLTSLSPLPDFTMIAQASRAHAERIERAQELPAALARAVDIIRREKRQVLLDVRVAVSDAH